MSWLVVRPPVSSARLAVGYCVVFIRLALSSEALWQERDDSTDEFFLFFNRTEEEGSRKSSGVEEVVGRVASGVSNGLIFGSCSISYRLAR